jgi:acetyltransferase-like isoleucine patch superfamily enzyme
MEHFPLRLVEEPFDDGEVAVGQFTYHFDDPFVRYGDRVEVGRFCSIAREVRILSGSEHALDLASTYPFRSLISRPGTGEWDVAPKGPTTIGNDVWIGFRATVLSGAQIGDGAVIGAGAIVSGTVPPYAIVAGNPGKVVDHRFDAATIERLLALRWWDWPIEQILSIEPYLYAEIGLFLDKAEALAAELAGVPAEPAPQS